ncbi:hypothetical protein HTZ77_17155 [Nonomuraea sp. SMC257]|uniref:Uncharacterized protein n=1 Tax=Nonomuraea montanisoli TaxID=2741721 RepID=A0A7Y6I7V1_9ACTN|nr:hypothetical protein [Nonomuraea montanisoli]NUW33146.1 hypothetical protein [Nonomuraea montanisoli]
MLARTARLVAGGGATPAVTPAPPEETIAGGPEPMAVVEAPGPAGVTFVEAPEPRTATLAGARRVRTSVPGTGIRPPRRSRGTAGVVGAPSPRGR